MKRRNSLQLRKALAAFSVIVMLFSQSAPVIAETIVDSTSETTQTSTIASDTTTSTNEVTTSTTSSQPDTEVETSVEPTVPQTDKTTLQANYELLTAAIANEASYTPNSYASVAEQLTSLVTTTEELLNDPAATQADVDATNAAITEALGQLVQQADKSSLAATIERAQSYQQADYSNESFTALTKALTAAQAVNQNLNATADEVAKAQADLTAAMDGLVKVEIPVVSQPESKPESKPETKPSTSQSSSEKPTTSSSSQPVQKPTTSTATSSTSTSSTATSTTKKSESTSATKESAAPSSSQTTTSSSTKVAAKNSSTSQGSDLAANLDESLAVDSLTASNLNGYELPLLSSFEDERQAAIISESLKLLGEPFKVEKDDAGYTNIDFPVAVFDKVFDENLGDTYQDLEKSGEKVKLDEAQPGDLLFWETDQKVNQVAIYLGQGKYILATDPVEVAVSESADDEDEAEKANEDTEGTEVPAGVQIRQLVSYDSEEEAIVLTEDDTDEEQAFEEPSFAVSNYEKFELTEYGQELIDNYAASLELTANPQTEQFIDSIAEDAQELGQEYDVFASVMIAQAILESGSGTSGLASAPYYNLFGVKGSYQGSSIAMDTLEDNGAGSMYQIQASFRSYPGYKASLTDYVKLIRGGAAGSESYYKDAWRSEAKNYLQATESLTGKYATDTQYNNKLNSIIATYHLTQYDELPTETGVVIQSRSSIPTYYREKMVYPDYDGVNYNTSGSYPVGQCTWYVYNRITQLGGTVDEFMGNGGEWGQKGAKLGYKTTQTPKVGYAVSFHPGVAGSSSQYGHVAFVEAVGPDGILVSEGNVVSPTTVSYRVIPNSIARSSNVTYIDPK
ncbi:MAG: glucosaminidase domain-containing protein [Enterococcus sp.]